jgi:hypothetical protein
MRAHSMDSLNELQPSLLVSAMSSLYLQAAAAAAGKELRVGSAIHGGPKAHAPLQPLRSHDTTANS